MIKTILTLILLSSFQAFSFFGPSNAEDLCKEIKNKDKRATCLNETKKPSFVQLSKHRLGLCEKMLKRKNEDLIINCVLGEFHPEILNFCEPAAHNGNLDVAHRCIDTFVGHTDVNTSNTSECGTGAITRISLQQRFDCYAGMIYQKPRTVEPPAPVGQQ
jgi:hypothetical protein